jgi:threonine aldolase
MHLDGARVFNALVETQDSPLEIGHYFDTVSICLSKGLGAPVGSLLLSSSENIKKARRVRKVFGGAMRQAGYLAAAGIYALDNHVDRLKQDHARAKQIADMLSKCSQVIHVEPVDTNIVIFSLEEEKQVSGFLEQLKKRGIHALGFGGKSIRMVTHLDIDDDMMEVFERGIKQMK